MKALLIVAAIIAVVLVYIRRAAVVPMVLNDGYVQDTDLTGGFVALREIAGSEADFIARITDIALATPRTVQISEAPLTFVTRSRWFGFPDITQVIVDDGRVTIHAHLVFGKSDLGVNKRRVLDWLNQLGPLTNPA